MKKKLFTTYFIIVLVTLLVAGTAFWNRGYRFVENMSQDLHLTQARMLVDLFHNTEFGGDETLASFTEKYAEAYGVRITLIDTDGTVITDSQSNPAEMANHKNREEVKEALSGESVSITRYSTTLKMTYCYSAVPIADDEFTGVLRVSVPLEMLNALASELIQVILVSLLAASGAAIVIAIFFSRYITKPIDDITIVADEIAKGNYDVKIYTRQGGQIGKLADSFNDMAATLKENMQNLGSRNSELEAILRSMDSGVVAVNNTDSVMFHNDSFAAITGIGQKDIINQPIYSIIRNAIVFDILDSVRENRSSIVREGRFDAGKVKIIRATGTPLYEAGNKPLGVLIVIEDITELKKLENMRRDFVSNVSRELETPLQSIRTMTDRLKEPAVMDNKEASGKFLDMIDIEAERLYDLIRDILLLSEIESRHDTDMAPCDIRPIAEEIMDMFSDKKGKDIDLIYRQDSELKPFVCRRDRIKALLANLVDNAISYTEKGSVTVTCKEQDAKLIINVSDTGIGIKEEYLPRIFERFYRVDKVRSMKEGGTGLGLSIVKHIVENYNGTIAVKSRPGEGTSITVELPYRA